MSTAAPTTCNKGVDLTLYYNTGDAETPVWVEHKGMIEDLTLNETEDENEMTARRTSRVVKEFNEGDIDVSITGTQITDPGYEGWQFLNSMRRGGQSRDVMILTGKIASVGSYGWRGDFRNFDRTVNGPAVGNMTSAVNLKPAAQCRTGHVEVRVVKIAVAGTAANFDPTSYVSSSSA